MILIFSVAAFFEKMGIFCTFPAFRAAGRPLKMSFFKSKLESYILNFPEENVDYRKKFYFNILND
jgi:hypothetical protein